MGQWWEIAPSEPLTDLPSHRAVAYYRHSAQDRQENSIPIQQDQVHEFAAKAGITIIEEFADAGKSGLNAEGRPAFTQMMEEWVEQRCDFTYVLCLDVSRWGCFQDIDLSAQFSAECKKHGKQVIYVAIGMPKGDDPLYPVYVLGRLRNETYVGTLLYNKTSQKLKTPRRSNPPEKWVRTEEAFEEIISVEQFLKAQEILLERRRKYDPAFMLSQIESLYQEHGLFGSSLLRLKPDLPATGTIARRFGSLDFAFQQLHREHRDRARQFVHEQICQHVPEVLPYSDFLVLDQRLALAIQPSVPSDC